MKNVFKFGMMFFLLYFGLKSGMNYVKTEFPTNKAYIDLIIFVLFVALPASRYWGHSIEEAFKSEPEDDHIEDNDTI